MSYVILFREKIEDQQNRTSEATEFALCPGLRDMKSPYPLPMSSTYTFHKESKAQGQGMAECDA